jgi:hypothetical protein
MCMVACRLQVETEGIVVRQLSLHFGTTWLVYYPYRQQQVEQLLGSTWDEASLVNRLPQLAADFDSVAGLTGSGQLVVGDRWPNGLRVVSPDTALWIEEWVFLAEWLHSPVQTGPLLTGEHDSIQVVKQHLQPAMVLLLPTGSWFTEEDISQVCPVFEPLHDACTCT